MTNKQILEYLNAKKEKDAFINFTKKIVNSQSEIIGVKTIEIKKLAKLISNQDYLTYLKTATLNFYEEKLLYGFVLGYSKLSLQNFLFYLEKYLKVIDSWALVDSPITVMKIIEKNKTELFEYLIKNLTHVNPYGVRFSIVAFFKFYLTEQYIAEVLKIYESIQSKEYYINIALAWGICEILIKFYNKGISLLKKFTLNKWVQNKAIQKACESFRISSEQKEFLKTLKKAND